MSTAISTNQNMEQERIEFYERLDLALDAGIVDESEVSGHLGKRYAEAESISGRSMDQ